MADESSFLVPILREMVYGIDAWKKPVKVVATSNVALTGLQTIDGVALASGDEVLCVGQSSAAQNGIWVAATGTWTRRFDAATSERLFEGVRVPVTRGTAGTGHVYRLSTTGKINVGTTAQTWELDSQGGEGVSVVDEIRYERPADADALDESYTILSRFLPASRSVSSASILLYDDLINPGAVDYARLQLVAYAPGTEEILVGELATSSNDFYGFYNEAGPHTPSLTIENATVPVGYSLVFRVAKEGAGLVLPRFVLFVEWSLGS